jgi:glycosyltransferase involved in cell wall biosynthesis
MILKVLNPKKIFDVPNGIPDVYERFKHSKEENSNGVNIIFLSNLFESKGIFILLEAICLIKDDLANCKFHFIGNWRSEKTKRRFTSFLIDNQIKNLIGNIGPKYNDEKFEFLSKMDILVFPTFYKHETWGLVNAEAMMFKIPIVASNFAGIPELVQDGKNGFLVQPRDARELSLKLLKLIKSKDLRVKFGTYGRGIFLKKFTIAQFEANMHEVFKEVDTI